MSQQGRPAATRTGPASSGRTVRGLDAGQRREQRRRDLLDAALRLFAERGHANVSIEEICQSAYVSTRSFYEIFDGKQECYLELYDELTNAMFEQLSRAVPVKATADPDQLHEIIGQVGRQLVENPEVTQIVWGQSASISPAVDARRRENRRDAARILQQLWTRYGLVTADDASSAADLQRQLGRPGRAPRAARDTASPAYLLAVGAIGGLFDLVGDWLHERTQPDEAERAELVGRLVAFHRVVCAGIPDALR